MVEAIEAAARAILERRTKPDFHEVVNGHWKIDHDLELARAAIDAYEAAMWRPIEEAPKNGTRVQLFPGPWGTVSFGKWSDDKYARKPRPYWDFDDDLGRVTRSRETKPTHFRMASEPAAIAALPLEDMPDGEGA